MHGINTISVNNDGRFDDRSSLANLIGEPARTNREDSPLNRTHAVSDTPGTQNGVCDTAERRHVHQLVRRAVSRPRGWLGVRWCRASERHSAQRHLPNVSNAFGAFGVGSPMAAFPDSLYAYRRPMLPKKICARARIGRRRLPIPGCVLLRAVCTVAPMGWMQLHVMVQAPGHPMLTHTLTNGINSSLLQGRYPRSMNPTQMRGNVAHQSFILAQASTCASRIPSHDPNHATTPLSNRIRGFSEMACNRNMACTFHMLHYSRCYPRR